MLTPWCTETLTHNMEVVFGRGASVLHDSKYGPSHHLSVNRVSCKTGLSEVPPSGRYEGVHIKAAAPLRTTSCNVALTAS